jgi:hypothetical protein
MRPVTARAELAGDVGVTVVHPGGIRTRIAETSRVAAAVTAAEQIVAAVEDRRPRLLIAMSARVPDLIARVAPARYPALLRIVQGGRGRIGTQRNDHQGSRT